MNTAASAGNTFSAQGGEGFAIPIRTALTIADEIVAGDASADVHIGGTAFLGVQGTAMQGSSGVAVAGWSTSSAAAAAGLHAGSVITAVDGKAVASPDSLGSVLRQYHPGDTVDVTWSDQQGRKQTTSVELGAGPAA